MNGFLDLYRVQYECPCGSWYPLSYLYYCKPCNHIRCTDCALEDVDKTYCPTCIDDTVIDDSRFGKGTCSVCYTCPVCSDKLVFRALVETNQHYLHCNSCMWNTNDAQLPSQARKNEWPSFPNAMEDKLLRVQAHLKQLSTFEKNETDKPSRRSMSNLGHVASGRYGILQLMETRRKKIMARPVSIENLNTSDVEELDPSVYTEQVSEYDVPKLEQVIRLPFCNPKAMYPIHLKMHGRIHVRCPEHDVTIYRGEFAILKTKPRHHIPCSDFCPELKFSHETDFSISDTFSVFITIMNSSFSPMSVKIEPQKIDDPNCLICDNEPFEFKGESAIQNKDTSGTVELSSDFKADSFTGAALEADDVGIVVFRAQHRVGVHLKCRAQDGCTGPEDCYLLLQVTYKTDKAEKQSTNRVKLYL
ncbi:unnamed protein product [Bursaphelenchus okinawaensis]|uniref:Dynactin subunit 4 n=1 Tax=Bursaphelenchus okinawaensis TaxID=465554 RepID=A0A811KSS6_9BILA|nr:unnamed protein product [Bursaphelenchus okinawaensis]CAG9111690.1 unnamed protein product [Bursaphelenchus okinawaensis]